MERTEYNPGAGKPSYLSGERVRLRAVEPEDLAVMYEMENDPQMWDISNFIEPYSRQLLREYIAENRNDVFADKQLRLMVELRETSEVVGTVDLDNFEPRHRRAGVGIAIRRAWRGQGIAGEALGLMLDYAFGFLRLHQLYAYVPQENEASRRLFCSAGFRETAVLDDWLWREGRYVPVVLLQKIQLR